MGRRLFCPAAHPQVSEDDLRCVAAAGTAGLADVAVAASRLAVA